MKKYILPLVAVLVCLSLNLGAQVVLTYNTQGLLPDTKNFMKLMEYAEPGNGGANVVWDFTTIKDKADFTGSIYSTAESSGAAIFPETNTALEEFGNYFFFTGDNDSIVQYGYMPGKGSSYIKYDKPFVKMIYPFTYGNSFSGDFFGATYAGNSAINTIQGQYNVTADAQGKLLLPNGVVHPNVIRVKEDKISTYQSKNNSYTVEDITYRWYASYSRYPVLVLIKSSPTACGNGITLAAYNSNVPSQNSVSSASSGSINNLDNGNNISIFPNPTDKLATISFVLSEKSNIDIKIVDAKGRFVNQVALGVYPAGEQNITFNANELMLEHGVYFVKVGINGNESVKSIEIQ